MSTAGTKKIVGSFPMVWDQNTRAKNLRSQKAKKIKKNIDCQKIPIYYIGVGAMKSPHKQRTVDNDFYGTT